ncbi:hypothetical protein OROMI_027698 [Orobanche minor]
MGRENCDKAWNPLTEAEILAGSHVGAQSADSQDVTHAFCFEIAFQIHKKATFPDCVICSDINKSQEFKMLADAADEFARMLAEGKLHLQLQMKSRHLKGDRLTHPDDWILAFGRSAEGRAIYRDRGKDSLANWWKGTENDFDRRSWRHSQYRN